MKFPETPSFILYCLKLKAITDVDNFNEHSEVKILQNEKMLCENLSGFEST